MPACPRCGTAFIHGQRFCIRCGSELAGPPGHGLPPDLAARVDIYEKRIDQDPLKPGLYLELGDAYREYRLFEHAVVQYQKAATIDPADYGAQLKSGQAYAEMAAPDRARDCFSRAARIRPDAVEAKLGLFAALAALNRHAEAVALGTDILKAAPQALDVRRRIAGMLVALGRDAQAIAEFEALAATVPGDAPVNLQLARLYQKNGPPDRALACLRKVAEADPNSVEARLQLGRLLAQTGSPGEAGAHLEFVLQQDPANASIRAMLADALLQAGKHADASRVLGEAPPAALQRLPAGDRELLASAHVALGSHLLDKDAIEPALAFLNHGRWLNPTPEADRLLARAHTIAGDSAADRADWAAAARAYGLARQFAPGDPAGRTRLDEVRARLRRRNTRVLLAVLIPVVSVILLTAGYVLWRRFGFGMLEVGYRAAEVDSITVDGRTWTGREQKVRLGRHTVTATGRPGYGDTTFTVSVPGGGAARVTIALTDLVRRIDGLTATASSTGRSYSAMNAVDGDTTTCWSEAERQPCLNQWLQLNLPARSSLTSIRVYPGYGKPHPTYGSLYWLNNRLQEAEAEFSDGTTRTLNFENEQGMQTITFDPPVEADWVKLIVRDIYEGALWDDLCVSEVELWGY